MESRLNRGVTDVLSASEIGKKLVQIHVDERFVKACPRICLSTPGRRRHGSPDHPFSRLWGAPRKGPFTGYALSFHDCLWVWGAGQGVHSVDFGINEDVGED